MSERQVFEVRSSRTHVAFFLVGSLLFVLAGAWMALVLPKTLVNVGVGWVSILFFGFGAALFAAELVRPRMRLVLDEEGIKSQGYATRLDLVVPWSVILHARVVAIHQSPMVALDLADTENRIQQAGPLMRGLLQANATLVGTPYALAPTLYGVSANGLADEINRRAREVRYAPQFESLAEGEEVRSQA